MKATMRTWDLECIDWVLHSGTWRQQHAMLQRCSIESSRMLNWSDKQQGQKKTRDGIRDQV
jgi:hypothetical protein